jgi:hypothetical protein
MRMRTPYLVLAMVLVASPVAAREVFVNNLTGDDRLGGEQPDRASGVGGPVRTLAKALRLAGPGDTIVLARTNAPYRESFTLAGSRHSGTAQRPFAIEGGGAILDGSCPAPGEAWEIYRGAVFRLRAAALAGPMLFLDGRPAVHAFAARAANEPPPLKPRQWCSVHGRIYFCVEEGKLPGDYKLSYAQAQTGITLFHVEHVRITGLTVQGFQVDGIGLSNSARQVRLADVTCRWNGRSGVSVGGASSVTIRESSLGHNGQAQLLTLPESETQLIETQLPANTAPGWVDQGGRVYVDGKQAQAKKDRPRSAGAPERQP